ncbi:hypothetical protein [Streptomyces clavifer]|uniref:hypothetical protein n=1 Tax=Streptomyces clavifer TaxID=68188 RepID=UPI0036CA30AA
MAFSHRIATLAAVVAIPLGIAATSYALADSPTKPEVPGRVELNTGSPSGSPDPGATGRPGPSGTGSPDGGVTTVPDGASPTAPPSDVVVPQPPATDSTDDDDDTDNDDDTDDG